MAGRWFNRLLLASCLVLISACGSGSDREEKSLTPVSFPTDIAGWIAAGDREHYDTESIFAYIDGHAEVYLSYGMKGCVSQRYTGPGGDAEIVVDLFEMASPADAFGVFSHDRAGEVVEIGRGGVFRHGWLSFWKGPWYASVYSTGGDENSRDAVLELGRAVADTLADGGDVPALVGRLPVEGLDPATVCFLRSPQILNAHVFVGSDNPLGLGADVEAVVGTYDLDGAAASLVLVRYLDEAAAEAVESAARELAESGGSRPPMMIGRKGSMLAAVVGAGADQFGESLIVEVLGGQK